MRSSANTKSPNAKARAASKANAAEREVAFTTATTIGGSTTAATPDPTAAIPATVATFVSNQRPMSMVEQIMPPKPYPKPVNTEPTHRPT